MIIKRIILGVFLSFLLLPSNLLAQQKVVGEVINVSIEHQVVFADVPRVDLEISEIVKIIMRNGEPLFLQVEESSSILTKLILPDYSYVSQGEVDLSLIKVGDKIYKTKKFNKPQSVQNLLPQNLFDQSLPTQTAEVLPQTVNQANEADQALRLKQIQMEKEMRELKMKFEALSSSVTPSTEQLNLSRKEAKELKSKLLKLKDKLTRMKNLIKD